MTAARGDERAAANVERVDETYDQPANSADTDGPTRQRWRTVGGKIFPAPTIHWQTRGVERLCIQIQKGYEKPEP